MHGRACVCCVLSLDQCARQVRGDGEELVQQEEAEQVGKLGLETWIGKARHA